MLDKSQLEIIEISRVEERPVPTGQERHAKGPFWKATIAFRDHLGVMLEGTWYLPIRELPDSSILPVVRHYLHSVCADIASQTTDWKLEEPQYEALKRPPPKPQTSSIASMASKIPQ
jgi:hypothetical protein